jgi:hypothetical protein
MTREIGEKWVDALPKVRKGRTGLTALLDSANAQMARVVSCRSSVDDLRRQVAKVDDPHGIVPILQKTLDLAISGASATGGVADAVIMGVGDANQLAGVLVSVGAVYTEVGNQLKDYA